MPSRIVQNPVDGSPQEPMDVDSSDAGKLLEDSIRATLPALPAAEASRYRRLLDNTLRAANPARQSALLKMLEANVRTAVAHQDAALSQATGWQSFVKTSVNVHFQGSVASMAKAKEEQLLSLQMDILKLPTDLATGYQTLLRAILATKGAAKRDALLTRMAKQVAARADPESEA